MPIATQRGGAEMMLLHLLRYARHGPIDLRLAFLQDGPMVGEARRLGYRAEVFPSGRLREPATFARTVGGLCSWMRRERLDTVLSWMLKGHLYAGPAAALAGLSGRTSWFQHGVSSPRAWMDRMAMLIPACEVWCPSRHTESAQQRMWPRRRTRVVYPSVDLADFSPAALPPPAEARIRVGLGAGGPVVGMVARLERWKGCDIFLEAAAIVSAQWPDARFVIVGGPHFADPVFPDQLHARAGALGLGDRFILTGHRTDVPVWVQGMDVVVHASRLEPFGMVVVEAMALGKAVVAAAAGGPLEVVRDGLNGRLCPVGDPAALAAIIGELLADPELRARLGYQARKAVEVRFGAQRLARDVADVLAGLASRG